MWAFVSFSRPSMVLSGHLYNPHWWALITCSILQASGSQRGLGEPQVHTVLHDQKVTSRW